jgi:hypothetical protein
LPEELVLNRTAPSLVWSSSLLCQRALKWRMTMGKYLIVVSKLQKHVPKALQKFVRGAIEAKFKEFDVVFDFDGKKKRRDLEATFSDEIPFMTIFG